MEIQCFGICSPNCAGWENGKCRYDWVKVPEPEPEVEPVEE